MSEVSEMEEWTVVCHGAGEAQRQTADRSHTSTPDVQNAIGKKQKRMLSITITIIC